MKLHNNDKNVKTHRISSVEMDSIVILFLFFFFCPSIVVPFVMRAKFANIYLYSTLISFFIETQARMAAFPVIIMTFPFSWSVD